MNHDWRQFKKTFTQEQEDAIWQYIIDHSKVQPNGFLGVMFYVRDVDDFWKRVNARYTGQFKRYERLDKEHRQQNTALFVATSISKRAERITAEIQSGKQYHKRVLLWVYRKCREYLYGDHARKVIANGGLGEFKKTLNSSLKIR